MHIFLTNVSSVWSNFQGWENKATNTQIKHKNLEEGPPRTETSREETLADWAHVSERLLQSWLCKSWKDWELDLTAAAGRLLPLLCWRRLTGMAPTGAKPSSSFQASILLQCPLLEKPDWSQPTKLSLSLHHPYKAKHRGAVSRLSINDSVARMLTSLKSLVMCLPGTFPGHPH